MMNHFQPRSIAVAFLALLPFVGFAQASGDVFGLALTLYDILVRIGQFFWVLAVMLFIWGVVKFIAHAGDTKEHQDGKRFIVWGIICFVVLLSLWGIVDLILFGTFGITPGGTIPYIDKSNSIVN